jgi:hypothetical protein
MAIPEFFGGTALGSFLTSAELLHLFRSFLHVSSVLQRFSFFSKDFIAHLFTNKKYLQKPF